MCGDLTLDRGHEFLLECCGVIVCLFLCLFPTRQEGVVRIMLESSFAMLVHHAPTQYPARAARQWIPPSIPPKQLASGSRRAFRQSSLPVDPAEYPARAACQWVPPGIPPELLASAVDPAEYCARAARQWIPPSFYQWVPPSIPPELLASGSRRVSRQSGSPVDPAEYPAREAGQWIPPSLQSCSPVGPAEYPAIPPNLTPELLATGSRQSGSPVDPAEYPARAARQWIPPSIPPEQHPAEYPRVARQWIPPSIAPEQPASGSRRASAEYPRVAGQWIPTGAARQWIPPSIPLSIPYRWILPSFSGQYQAGAARQYSPVDPASFPPEQLASLVLLNVPPGAQLGLHFMLVPSCFECTLRLGKGDAFVLLWVVVLVYKIPRRVSF